MNNEWLQENYSRSSLVGFVTFNLLVTNALISESFTISGLIAGMILISWTLNSLTSMITVYTSTVQSANASNAMLVCCMLSVLLYLTTYNNSSRQEMSFVGSVSDNSRRTNAATLGL